MVATRREARRSGPRASRSRVAALAVALLAAALIAPAAALGVSGDFTPAPTSPQAAGNGPTSVVATDLNGDANVDLAVANEYSDDVTILLGDGSGDFTPAPTSPVAVGNGPTSVAGTDVNGDANADLAVANGYSDNVTILLGDGSGNFTPAPTSPVAAGLHPTSVAAGYLGPEPNADLVVANGGSDDVSILLGDGSGDFTPAPTSPEAVGDGPTSISLTCLGSIGTCTTGVRDLVVANGGDDSVSTLYQLIGGSDFFARPPLPVGVGPTSFVLGPRYSEYSYFLAVANGGSDTVSILLFGGTPASTSPEAVGNDPTSIVAADLNGDARFGDLAVANRGSDNVSILLHAVALPPALPPARAAPTGNPVQLKKCIKKAKKKYKDKPAKKKRAIKKCRKKFG